MEFPELQKPNYTYRAKVVRIIDGDTIDVDIDLGFSLTARKRLRFLGIDAWETRGEERELGIKAKERLHELLEGHTIYVQTEMDAEGKYGRLLAWLWLETDQEGFINVNNLLLQEGHGEEVKY